MHVFFTGSPRALLKFRREHVSIFEEIVKNGFKHLSRAVIDADPNQFYEQDQKQIIKHYQETLENLRKADIVVVEASTNSMSMGFLVNQALELDKPVIVFHLRDHTPFFFLGIQNEKLHIYEYSLDNVAKTVKDALDYAKDNSDVRFNFLISPRIGNYLDWVARHKKVPKSVYLRQLIEMDMKLNQQ